MRALISVYDKSGVVDFARGLESLGWQVFSTGGTRSTLLEAAVRVGAVEEITGFPEILEGRVKTLHPLVHGGLLARRDKPEHMAQLIQHSIHPIDMVAVNLYPFLETVSQDRVALDDALENIDIGGPTMLRAAAKNFPSVLVVVDPADYQGVLAALEAESVDMGMRRSLAAKAFQHVAYYDTIVAQYLRDSEERFPQELTLALRLHRPLRYGENPHQKGALYRDPIVGYSSLVLGEQSLGQDPSLCNYNDLSAALETVRDFLDRPAAVVIKHATPSGFALGDSIAQALEKAIHADATSAFGGIIGLNRELDMDCAQVIARFKDIEASNIDAIVAPGADAEAVRLLRQTRRRMILFTVPPLASLPEGSMNLKHLPGGMLVQEANIGAVDQSQWKVVSKVAPTEEQVRYMADAWTIIRRIRSNTILIWDGSNGATLGIGSGQTSRVGAAKLALEQAGETARGAILASDSFFPFGDTVELAARYGVGAIIQQGGSINDQSSIDAADVAGIPMVMTGERAFWH